jgi:hypothetical protein
MVNKPLFFLCSCVIFLLSADHAHGRRATTTYPNDEHRFVINNPVHSSIDLHSKVNRTQTPLVSWHKNAPRDRPTKSFSLSSSEIKWTAPGEYSGLTALFLGQKSEETWLLTTSAQPNDGIRHNVFLDRATTGATIRSFRPYSAFVGANNAKIENMFVFKPKNV